MTGTEEVEAAPVPEETCSSEAPEATQPPNKVASVQPEVNSAIQAPEDVQLVDSSHLSSADAEAALQSLDNTDEACAGLDSAAVQELFDGSVQPVEETGVAVADAEADLANGTEASPAEQADAVCNGHEQVAANTEQDSKEAPGVQLTEGTAEGQQAPDLVTALEDQKPSDLTKDEAEQALIIEAEPVNAEPSVEQQPLLQAEPVNAEPLVKQHPLPEQQDAVDSQTADQATEAQRAVDLPAGPGPSDTNDLPEQQDAVDSQTADQATEAQGAVDLSAGPGPSDTNDLPSAEVQAVLEAPVADQAAGGYEAVDTAVEQQQQPPAIHSVIDEPDQFGLEQDTGSLGALVEGIQDAEAVKLEVADAEQASSLLSDMITIPPDVPEPVQHIAVPVAPTEPHVNLQLPPLTTPANTQMAVDDPVLSLPSEAVIPVQHATMPLPTDANTQMAVDIPVLSLPSEAVIPVQHATMPLPTDANTRMAVDVPILSLPSEPVILVQHATMPLPTDAHIPVQLTTMSMPPSDGTAVMQYPAMSLPADAHLQPQHATLQTVPSDHDLTVGALSLHHPSMPQSEGNLQQAVMEAANMQPDAPLESPSEPLLTALASGALPTFIPTAQIPLDMPQPPRPSEGDLRYCVTCGNQIKYDEVCFAESIGSQFNYYCKGCAAERRQSGVGTELVVVAKKCAKCNEVKSATEFNRYGRNSEGLHSYCKICSRKDSKSRREKFPPVEVPTVDHQVCSVCKEDKPASEFTRDKTRRTGLSHRCRSCKVQQNARCCERRATQPKQIPDDKVCSCCNEKKPSSEFWKRPTSTDGLRSECKACSAKRYRQWLSKVGTEVTVETKVCKTCGAEKPATEFHKNNQRHDGLEANCAVCRTAVRAKRRPPPPVPSKVCQKCFQLKDASEFKRKSSMPDGLVKTCKECCQKGRSSKKARSGRSGSDDGASDALPEGLAVDVEPLSEQRCSGCKQVKPADQFNKRKCTRTGLDWYCKACTAERAKKRRRQSKGDGGDVEGDMDDSDMNTLAMVGQTVSMPMEAVLQGGGGNLFTAEVAAAAAAQNVPLELEQKLEAAVVGLQDGIAAAAEDNTPNAKRIKLAEDVPTVQVQLIPTAPDVSAALQVQLTHDVFMSDPAETSFTDLVQGTEDFTLPAAAVPAQQPMAIDHAAVTTTPASVAVVAPPVAVASREIDGTGVGVSEEGGVEENDGELLDGVNKFQEQLDNLSKLQEQLRSVLQQSGNSGMPSTAVVATGQTKEGTTPDEES